MCVYLRSRRTCLHRVRCRCRQTFTPSGPIKHHNKEGGRCRCLRKLERETGFEPATLALARRCSTTELFPLLPDQIGSGILPTMRKGCQASRRICRHSIARHRKRLSNRSAIFERGQYGQMKIRLLIRLNCPFSTPWFSLSTQVDLLLLST